MCSSDLFPSHDRCVGEDVGIEVTLGVIDDVGFGDGLPDVAHVAGCNVVPEHTGLLDEPCGC